MPCRITSVNHAQRIKTYVRPYKGLLAVTFAIIAVGIVFALVSPLPFKIILDYVVGNSPPPKWLLRLFGESVVASKTTLLVVTAVVWLAVMVVENLMNVVSNWVTTRLDQGMVLDFRSDLFQHAQRLSLPFHDQNRSGPLIYAINFQANAAAGIVLAIPPIIESLLLLVGLVAISFSINWKLAALALAVTPFLWLSISFYAKQIDPRLRAVKQMEQVSLSIIHEAINMLRVIVAFGREGHEYDRFRKQGEIAADARVRLTVRQTLFQLAVKLITGVGTIAVVAVGANEVLRGKMKVGDLWMIVAYIGMIYKPLEAMSYTLGSVQNNVTNLKMASELLDIEPEIADKTGAVDVKRAVGAIEFRDVSFSYTGRVDTLSHISFTADAGQVVAIVGPTGAGKTTLISLIPRFYAPSSGQILIDGRDITDITLRSLRDQISMVLQEPLLFSGTIADNIRYGKLGATQDDVIAAAKNANAHDFITRLPKQYETEIGERGVQLSGGERQRICVARAFLKDAPILILDEPTSAIDSKTEAVILDALDLLMQGRTTFMIAHRLSTVRRADKILVMEQGKLIESGRHEELIELGGLYKQLHDVQIGQGRKRRVLETAAGVVPQ
jgi:ATP-binding cassette, subfamily B, bacterial